MSRVEKLQIQGIRSFGVRDEEKARIDFVCNGEAMPLTLILGQNGCGKTTIIECLRYITTGDCPPGSHGGRSFVHDPKMARESKVIGHVKLQFRGLDGRLYIIGRTIEAAQKLKTIAIKTLDAVITRKGLEGESNSSISGKCADVNAQMAIHLGVSKAILNYVIFCHQEDSNWPLDEGSKVKDKFDEIFASAKYKDCLKRIKDVRSKHMEQLRLEANELKYLAEDKEIVREKRSEKARKENTKEILENDLSEIDENIRPIEEELGDIRKVKSNFVDIEKDIASAEKGLELCQREATHLESNLEFIIAEATNDDEILRMKEEVEEECELKRNEVDNIKEDIKVLEKEIVSQEFEIKKASALIGQYRESQLNYGKNKNIFKSLISGEGVNDFRLSPLEDEDDVRDRENALKQINQRVKSVGDDVMQKSRKWDDKIEFKSKAISDIEIKKAKFEEQKKQKQVGLIKAKKEVAVLRKKLNELERASDKLESIRRRYEAKCLEVEREENAVDLDQIRDRIKQNKTERSILFEKESELKEERNILEDQRQILSEMEIKKSDRAAKSKKLEKILSRRRNELKEIFSTIPKAEELKEKFNDVFENCSKRFKNNLNEESKYKSDLANLKESRNKLSAELENKRKRIRDFIKNSSELLILGSDGEEEEEDNEVEDVFEKEMEISKGEVEKTRSEVQVKEANIFTFKEYVHRLKESDSPCCPTCNRAFHKQDEVKELLSDLEAEIRRIPNKVKSIKTKLNKAESRRDAFFNLLPEKRQCDELKREISEKRSELLSIEKKIKENESKLKKIEDVRDVVSLEINTCEDLREDILNVDRIVVEVSKLDNDIDEIQSSLGSKQNYRDYKVVKAEEETVTSNLNRVRGEIEKDQAVEMRHEKRMNDLSREKNQLTEDKLKVEAEQQERSNIEVRKLEFEESIKEYEADLEKLSSTEIEPLEEEIEKLNGEKIILGKEKNKEIELLNNKLDKTKNFENRLVSLLEILKDYENSDNETKFQKHILNQEKLSKAKDKNDIKRKSLEKNKFDAETFITNQSSRKRSIDDNLRLRNFRSEEKKHKGTIDRFKDKVKALNLHSYAEKEKKLLNQKDSLEATRNNKKGRLDEVKRNLGELERELRSPKFRDAENRYREKHVIHQCRIHVVSDLNKYYVALDWAIMKFHHERMQVINKIIRELWRATYKGNDIDYIEIKTDDADGLTSGADKRRVYNYHVVMIKNDTELEMRGRCSAGQKVLASLIIRLALAETFSSNCGIIALDEPTTNLDRENICSLADALARIVQERSGRSNFQLIVITHDEDLIDQLGRVERVDKYYKVSRNENGLSQIRKFNIHSLEMED